ncbi:MAG: smalltalk protein [Prevotella sp.]|nr:smalltalk protein [Prevotella sp.]
MKNREIWRTILNILSSIITAALTAISTTSCM